MSWLQLGPRKEEAAPKGADLNLELRMNLPEFSGAGRSSARTPHKDVPNLFYTCRSPLLTSLTSLVMKQIKYDVSHHFFGKLLGPS